MQQDRFLRSPTILRRVGCVVLTLGIAISLPAAAEIAPGTCNTATPGDLDGDGFSPQTGDCNEDSALQSPGNLEQCDGYDNDCDGRIDELPECHPVCNALDTTEPIVLTEPVLGLLPASHRIQVVESRLGAWNTTDPGGRNRNYYLTVFDRDGSNVVQFYAASSSGNFEMAWTGSQFGVLNALALSGGAARMDLRLLDPAGQLTRQIPLDCPFCHTNTRVALVWTGQEFVAIYGSNREFHRLDRNGDPLTPPIPYPGGDLERMLAVGDHLALLTRSGNTITFSRLRLDGTLIGPPQSFAAPAISRIDIPEFVWTGDHYVAVWRNRETDSPIQFGWFDANGLLVSEEAIAPPEGESTLRDLSWTGSRLAISFRDTLWLREGPGDPGQLFAQSRPVVWDGTGWAEAYVIRPAEDPFETWRMAYSRRTCICTDGDGDGESDCFDCDDTEASIYTGAPQICDGLNNDCADPGWPSLAGNPEGVDDDGDGMNECEGDCDDTDADTHPGAMQQCDGTNNDCDDPDWPQLPADEVDGDADGAPQCADCDDGDPRVYPGASEACDGVRNDCDHPEWPVADLDEVDSDGDGFAICAADCDDGNAAIHPCAEETCNAIDDDCDSLIDEDAIGEDSDGDGARNLCDNCPSDFNPGQEDADTDATGDPCDNCPDDANADQSDEDGDTIGDVCDACLADPVNDPDVDMVCHTVDNCPGDTNPQQEDADGDSVGDICDPCPFDATNDGDADGTCEDVDNCPGAHNADQSDLDADTLGDVCDNCPADHDPTQADSDADGTGDACDTCTDPDGDGFGDPAFPATICTADNCPGLFNELQADADGDLVGDVCDNCPADPNSSQSDIDLDTLGDPCDSCPEQFNIEQLDSDGDGAGNVCDNCPAIPNGSQADLDGDDVGDICDADDGLIYPRFDGAQLLVWPAETGFSAWNVYRFDLAIVRSGGEYTQVPGSNPIAARGCGLLASSWTDTGPVPPPGGVAGYLITGRNLQGESTLGNASSGALRPNDNPCP